MTKTLPRNFTHNLHTYTMDQLATAYTIVQERAVGASPVSAARARALNIASAISEEVFQRQFRFVRCGDGTFSFERFEVT